MRIIYTPHEYLQQRQRQKKRWIYPVLSAMEATYYIQKGYDVIWDKQVNYQVGDCIKSKNYSHIPFLDLPIPDRVLTDAFNRKYQNNGNFKHLPGTYMLSASGCWHGKCSFCVEQNNEYHVRPVETMIAEVEICKRLGFREVFDDSGTFPIGGWLEKFCKGVKKYNIKLGCNMRCVDIDYNLLADSGFRMVLFGIESANQQTLDKINKGVNFDDFKYVKKAREAGLEPHIAVMFGYPWETDEDACNTLRLVWYLLRKGYANTAQASLYCPTQETKGYCVPNHNHAKYVGRIYEAAYHLDFWFNKLKNIQNIDDLKYLWRQIKTGIGGLING